MFSIAEFPNLLFSVQVVKSLKCNKSLTEDAKKKIFLLLYRLNEFGALTEYIGFKKLKKLQNGWYELRIKQNSNNWRILFRQSPNSKMYGLIYIFLKQQDKINKKNWDIAVHIAASESWL